MSQIIIDVGSAPDDGTGDPIRDAFIAVNNNFTQIFSAGPVTSNIRIANNTITTTVINGNIVLAPSGIGVVQTNTTIQPKIDNVYDLGTPTARFNTLYLGTGGFESVGNITANYFIGNGSLLTGVIAAASPSIVNGNTTVTIPAQNGPVLTQFGACVVANISNVSARFNLPVSANAVVANTVTADEFIGNISGRIVAPGANTEVLFNQEGNVAAATGLQYFAANTSIAVSGTIAAQDLSVTNQISTAVFVTSGNANIGGSAYVSGDLDVVANTFVFGNLEVFQDSIFNSNLDVSGNLDVGNILTPGAANIGALSVTGNTQLSGTVQTGAATVTSLVSSGNLSAANIITAGSMTATGNLQASNVVTSGNVNALNINITNLANVSGNFVAANAQVTSLTVASISSGNLLPTANVTYNLGSPTLRWKDLYLSGNTLFLSDANIKANATALILTNPLGGQFIVDGTGISDNSRIQRGTSNVSIPIANAEVLIASGGNLIANIHNAGLSVSGNIAVSGNTDITGNISGGNINTAGGITAAGNITGNFILADLQVIATGDVTGSNIVGIDSVQTPGFIVAIGNVSGGNLNTTGLISATGNVTGGNITTAGRVTATGNVTGGNITTTGIVTATGNVTGGNLTTSGEVAAATANVGNLEIGNIISNLRVTQNALIDGNLTVNGNVTYVNVEQLNVQDPIIGLGRGANDTPLTTNDGKDRGEQLWYYSGSEKSAFIGYDNSGGNLIAAVDASITNEIVTVNSFGNFVAGNIVGGNVITTGSVLATSNVSGGNVITTGLVSASGNITGGNLVTAGNTDAANVNAVSAVSAGTTVTATGNVAGGNITTAGRVDATGNVTGGNLVTIGNIVGANIDAISAISAGTTITATGNVSGGNITTAGRVDATANVTGGNVTATSNVTGVGGVFSGNITAANFIGNIQGNVDAGGSNTQIQFNDGDILAGSAAFTFDKSSNLVTATGNVAGGNLTTAGQVTATGNVTGGNITTAGQVTATSNVTGGNLVTSGRVDATGNIAGANLTTTGRIDATGNIAGANLTTTGRVDATGNITGGNFSTAGQVLATGNVTGGNVSTTGQVVATGNITAAAANIAGNVVSGANITGANVIATANVAAAGNVSASYFIGNGALLSGIDTTLISSGNSNVKIVAANGNATINIAGTSNVAVFANTGAAITGTLTVSGNITGGNLSTSGSGGNITGANVVSANTFTAAGNVDSANVSASGTIVATGNVTGGNVTTAGRVDAVSNVAGGNITTVGRVDATSNVAGGNITTVGRVDATGNVAGGNITTTGRVDATSNVAGGNITTTGRVDATGNVAGGNITTTGRVDATGNVAGGNITTVGRVDALGNVTGSNLVTTGTVSATGNIITAANVLATANVAGGNITTTGRVDATGNVAGGNITTTGRVDATGNVAGGNITTTGRVDATGVVSAANLVATNSVVANAISAADLLISATGNIQFQATGNRIDMGGADVHNVGYPQDATDAATKQYVDDAVSSGIHIHDPVQLETPVALPAATYAQGGTVYTVTDTIAGNTVVFSTAANLQPNDQLWFANSFEGIVANTSYFVVSAPNTSAAVLSTTYDGVPVSNITSNTGLTESVRVNSGIGATLTANTNGALTVDSVAVSVGNRILVYNQVTQYENGVYTVTDTGNATAPWILTRATDSDQYAPDTNDGMDSGSYYFVQQGATGAGESYVLTAPQLEYIIGFDAVEFTQFSASQVYSANSQAGIDLTGTVFSAKIDGETTAFDGGGNISVKASANLVTPNIGAATGNTLSTTGNITAPYFIGNLIGNITGNLSVLGPNTGVVFNDDGLANSTAGFTFNKTTNAVSIVGNASAGNLSTVGLITAAGNITGAAILANAAVISGNLEAEYANITTTAGMDISGGNLRLNELTGLGGELIAQGNVSGLNVNTGNISLTGNVLSNLLVDGNIAGGNIDLTGNIEMTGGYLLLNELTGLGGELIAQGNVTGLNVNTGNISLTGNVLSNLWVDGNISATNAVFAGQLDVTGSNIDIVDVAAVGGNLNAVGATVSGNVTANYFLGNGACLTGVITSVANINNGNSNVEISVPDGNVAVTVDGTANVAVFANTGIYVTGVLDVSANVTGGNVNTAGLISATGNITGGNLGTSGAVTATGNVTGGNLVTGGIVDATGNVAGGNLTTAGIVDATGNVTGGNLVTGGIVDATGNVAGGNLTTAGTVVATGNVDGGNINATANVTGAGAVFSGNVTADTFIGNIEGNIDAGGSNTQIQFNDDDILNGSAALTFDKTSNAVTATGNISGGNLGTSGAVTATGNISGGNLVTAGLIDATGNITGGNITTSGNVDGANVNASSGITAGTTVAATGNVSGGNITTAGAVDATGNVTGGNLVTTGAVDATGNVTGGNINATANVVGVGAVYSGNVTANYFLGNGACLTGVITSVANINNGTSNVEIAVADGNVAVTVNGTANVAVFANSGLSVTGLISATGNVSGDNIQGNALDISNDAVINGNLTVNGNVTYVNVEQLNVQDPIIGLGRGANNDPLTTDDGKDRGEQLWYYDTSEKSAFIGYDNSADKLIAAVNVTITNEVVTVGDYGNFQVGVLEATEANITGNITANYFLGNGSQLTGISGGYETINLQGNVTGDANGNSVLISSNSAGNLQVIAGNGIVMSGNATSGNIIISIIGSTNDGTLWGGGGDAGLVTDSVTSIEDNGLVTDAVTSAYDLGELPSPGGGTITVSSTPPAGNPGDMWIDSDDGTLYLYFDDGDGAQWAEMASVYSINQAVDLANVASNIIPSANVTYDLGNTTNRWNDIWLANSTIHIGEAAISASGANLVLPATVQIGDAVLDASSGNLALPENLSAVTVEASGDITANSFIGDGSQLTGISAGISTGKAIAMAIVFGG